MSRTCETFIFHIDSVVKRKINQTCTLNGHILGKGLELRHVIEIEIICKHHKSKLYYSQISEHI